MFRQGLGGVQSCFRGGGGFGPPIFMPNLKAGGTGVDLVSGVVPVTSISGTRYGIVNEVVTQFVVNQPPIEDDGLRGCPAFTQLAKQSETLTDAVWNRENINLPVLSGTFQGANVWFLSETTANGFHTCAYQGTVFTSLPDNSVVGYSFIFKSANRKIFARIIRKDNIYLTTRINNITGVIESASSGLNVSVEKLEDSFFRVFISASIATGGFNSFARIDLGDYANNASYIGDGVSGILISRPTYINFGVGGTPFIPPYVPNNTTGSISVVSEAATATGTSYDLDDVKLARLKTVLRGPNAQGHLEFKLKLNFNRSWKTTNTPILSVNNDPTGDFLYYSVPGNIWSTYDTAGNKAQIGMASFDVGQTINFVVDYGTHPTGQKQRLTVNGVKSTLINFSGSWGANDLRFFYNAGVHAGWIVKDSLKVMDRPQW